MRENLIKSQIYRHAAGKSGVKPARKVILKNGAIIDGVSPEPVSMDILVIEGKIAELGPEIEVSADFDGEVVDLQDKLICPGFFVRSILMLLVLLLIEF